MKMIALPVLSLLVCFNALAVEALPPPNLEPGRYVLRKEVSKGQACVPNFEARLGRTADGDLTVELGGRQGYVWRQMQGPPDRQGKCAYDSEQTLRVQGGEQIFVQVALEKCDDGAVSVGSERRTLTLRRGEIDVKLETLRESRRRWRTISDCKYLRQ